MAWSPILPLLRTVTEFQDVNETIGYIGSFGSVPVTITEQETDPTITVFGDTISGYFSEAFEHKIYYRPTGDVPSEDVYQENVSPFVTKWSDLPPIPLQIYHYDADPTLSKTFYYDAQAGAAQQTYNIVVTNDYTPGRNQMIKNLNFAFYEQYIRVEWINSNSDIIPWVNAQGQTVDWESSGWQ